MIFLKKGPLGVCLGGPLRGNIKVHHQIFGQVIIQGAFFYWSALKMTKYEEKVKYLNWSTNCSSRTVLSVKPQ